MIDPDDDLDPLLILPPGEPNPTARAAVLKATTGMLRRRAIVRKGAVGGGVLVLFAAGAAAGWFAKPTPLIEREVVYLPASTVEAPPVPVRPPDPDPPVLSADELEQKAELSDDPAEVARLYRAAGDRYLTAARDYAQAARCYRLHLDAAGERGRDASATDSWLLLSMKTTH